MAQSKEELKSVESIGEKSTEAIIVMIVVTFVVGIVLKGVLSKLWAMVGTF